MQYVDHHGTGLFVRYWVLCLLEAATRTGLAPAGRPQLFALAYFANALADTFQVEAVQRAVLRKISGPRLSDVAIELDRLTGLGLCRVTRVVGIEKKAALKPQYFASDIASVYLERACSQSEHLRSFREFHQMVAIGFSDLGVPNIVDGSIEEASYSDLAIGEDEIIDLGGIADSYPTLEAIRAVQDALPAYRDRTAFGAIQVYGRYLNTLAKLKHSERVLAEDAQ